MSDLVERLRKRAKQIRANVEYGHASLMQRGYGDTPPLTEAHFAEAKLDEDAADEIARLRRFVDGTIAKTAEASRSDRPVTDDLVEEVARALFEHQAFDASMRFEDFRDEYVGNAQAALAVVDRLRVGFAVVPIEPTEAMIRAGRGALKDYIEGLSMEERAKLRPRKTAKSDNAGYYIKPQTKAAVRWRAMVAAAMQANAKRPVEEPADRGVPAEGERGISDDPDGFPV